jgi:hypothetical protein
MFALIETNGASHIAINIPLEGADKSMPALAKMLETNTVFIDSSWSEVKTVTPKMSIQLGNVATFGSRESEVVVVVPGSENILDDSFVVETPEVRLSNKKAIKEKEDQIDRLQLELAQTKRQLADLQESINRAAKRMEEEEA